LSDGRGSRWRPRPSTFPPRRHTRRTSPPQQSRTRELFSMSAETPAATGQFTRRRLQFRAWRGQRPFWAGLFVMLGGLPIAYFPYANLQLGHLTLAMATTA